MALVALVDAGVLLASDDAAVLGCSPLSVDRIRLVVESTEGGFTLAVEARDSHAAEVVLSRARALLSSRARSALRDAACVRRG